MIVKNRVIGNNSQSEFFIALILFLFCPILALIFILKSIYNGNYKVLPLLSLFMSLIAIITPAFADIYRHTLRYFDYMQYGGSEILQSNEHDFIFYTLTNFFAQNGIPFEFVSAIFVFICYQVAFHLFRQTLTFEQAKFWNQNTRFIIFLTFYLMVPFIAIINGLRMCTACYIGVWSWYHLYNKRYIRGCFCYLIALGMHFGSLLFLPVMIYSLFFRRVTVKFSWFIIFSGLLLITGNILLRIIPESMIESLEMESQVTKYMEESVENFDDTMSLNGLIANWLERLPLVVVFILVIFKKLKLVASRVSFVYILFLSVFLYLPFTTLFRRFAWYAIPIMIFLSFTHEQQSSLLSTNKLAKILLLTCTLTTVSYMYGHREVFMATKFYKLIYPSVITIATTDTAENFKDALIPNWYY